MAIVIRNGRDISLVLGPVESKKKIREILFYFVCRMKNFSKISIELQSRES